MSTRLQVLLSDDEINELRVRAKRRGVTVSELVREALRQDRRREPSGDVGAKLDAIRTAARHEFPTGDVGQILAEIESGYAP